MQKYHTHQKKNMEKHTETQASSKFRDGILLILNGIKPDTVTNAGWNMAVSKISKPKERYTVFPSESLHPKNPDPSKVAILRTQTPAIEVQTLPCTGGSGDP